MNLKLRARKWQSLIGLSAWRFSPQYEWQRRDMQGCIRQSFLNFKE